MFPEEVQLSIRNINGLLRMRTRLCINMILPICSIQDIVWARSKPSEKELEDSVKKPFCPFRHSLLALSVKVLTMPSLCLECSRQSHLDPEVCSPCQESIDAPGLQSDVLCKHTIKLKARFGTLPQELQQEVMSQPSCWSAGPCNQDILRPPAVLFLNLWRGGALDFVKEQGL